MHSRSNFRAAILATLILSAIPAGSRADAAADLAAAIAGLKSDDAARRTRAAESIGSLKLPSEEIARALLPIVLEQEGAKPNQAAFESLLTLGSGAVPVLDEAVSGDDSLQRRIALFAIGRLGHTAKRTIPAVRRLLTQDDLLTRHQAVETLGAMGAREAIPDLLPMLEERDPELLIAVLTSLTNLNVPADSFVPVMNRWLESDDRPLRKAAARMLATLGPEAAPAAPALLEALKADDPGVRVEAVRCLGRIGPRASARKALPQLVAALDSDEWAEARPDVAESLWRIARHERAAGALEAWLDQSRDPAPVEMMFLLWKISRSEKAIAALERVLHGGDPAATGRALEIIGKIGPEATAAMPAAGGLLQDQDRTLRLAAALAIARFGERAKENISDLKTLLEDDEPFVRAAAAKALWRVAADPKPLISLLSHDDPGVRRYVAEQLAAPDAKVSAAVPALKKALADPEAQVRIKAAEALWIQAKDDTALPAVLACLKDRDPQNRNEAASVLGHAFGLATPPVIESLGASCRDADSAVRSSAAEALGRLGPPAKAAVPALISLIKDDQPDHVLSSAVEALGLIGPAARDAAPALRKLLAHADPYVRVVAVLSLWHIEQSRAGLAALKDGRYSRNIRVRIVAAEALGYQGDPAAVPALLECLVDAQISDRPSGANERYMIARALSRLGPLAQPAAPALRHFLTDEDPIMRETVREALRRIDPTASEK